MAAMGVRITLIKRRLDSGKGQVDPGQHPSQLEMAGAPESVRFGTYCKVKTARKLALISGPGSGAANKLTFLVAAGPTTRTKPIPLELDLKLDQSMRLVRVMKKVWTKAVEEAADTIGEMLVESVKGGYQHSYEDIAGAALEAGISFALRQEPSDSRVQSVAEAVYEQLHDPKQSKWASLLKPEKSFWLDIGRAAISASDRELLHEIQPMGADKIED